MRRRSRSYADQQREIEYNHLYGHLSVRIEWETGFIQMPYVELMMCSKKKLAKIVRFAAKCGGWKLINHNQEEPQ